MGDKNHIRTLRDYSTPSHKGYRNTIELLEGNNVVPLLSDTIWLVQNECSFHGLRSEDPNQHLKDFIKLVDSLDLDVANRERTHMRLFQFALRDQASNWLERLPAGSIFTWEDLTTRFLAQFFLPRRTEKLCNDILMDFAKPVKAISLPQDVPSIPDRRLIKGKNQVQRLMEAYFAPKQPTQVNKITSSCEICSGVHNTQYCIKNPEQAFVEYASSHTDEAGGKWYTFKLEQNSLGDTYNPSWKSHPNLRWRQPQDSQNNFAIIDLMARALPSDTVKNPKLNVNPTSLVLFARSYPTEDPQCSTRIHGSINAITICPKRLGVSQNRKPDKEEQEEKDNLENINANGTTN
nr:MAK10-like protein [Tanacetum cinerariifolium]